jgi:hypothetical protein
MNILSASFRRRRSH